MVKSNLGNTFSRVTKSEVHPKFELPMIKKMLPKSSSVQKVLELYRFWHLLINSRILMKNFGLF